MEGLAADRADAAQLPALACSVGMAGPVVSQCFSQRCLNVLSVLAPGVVGIPARHHHGANSVATLAVPLEEHDTTLCANLLNLQYQFIKYVGSAVEAPNV